MRFTEAMLIIPEIFLLIVMAKFFGSKIPNIHMLGRDVQRQRGRHYPDHRPDELDVPGAHRPGGIPVA